MARIIVLLGTSLTVYLAITTYKCLQAPPVPKLDDTWWGPGEQKAEDKSIRAFKIHVEDKAIADLKSRLENVRQFPLPLEGIEFQYGFNTDTLSKIVEHWKTKYDWRAREKQLNQLPQFRTTIQGLGIHFIHVIPKVPKTIRVIPLLLLHGWPGSVREFYEIIPMLTTPRTGEDFVFEVIAPSLPGYAFSSPAARPGLGPAEIAVVMKNLMARLGHQKFYVQGGDWGAFIVASIATLFPENVLGLHSNMCFVSNAKSFLLTLIGSIYPPWFIDMKFAHRVYPIGTRMAQMLEESGYFHLQATKPDTIGVALSDSPVGLAAYILEKFSTGTNVTYKTIKDGGLLEKYTYDDLLDNVMLFWWTNSFTSAMRLYAEATTIAERNLGLAQIPISEEVPCACTFFPFEISYQPDYILKLKYTNLIQTTTYESGGHFAAFEVPDVLSSDIWTGIGKMESLRKR